jgi:hypothetical protein
MYSKFFLFLLINKILSDQAYIKISNSKKELESIPIKFIQESIALIDYDDSDRLGFMGKICLQTSLEDLKKNCIDKWDNYNQEWVNK